MTGQQLMKQQAMYRTWSNLRSCLSIIIAILGIVVHSGSASGQSRNESESAGDTVTIVLDRSRRMEDRFVALGEVLSLAPDQRRSGLHRIVQEGDEDFAALAATHLIREGDTGVVKLVNPLIERWSDNNKVIVFQAIPVFHSELAFGDIAREYLKQVATTRRAPAPPSGDPLSGPVDLAAIIIAKDAQPKDCDLLRTILPIVPWSRGVWIALAEIQCAGTPERELAAAVIKDEVQSPVVRAAASLSTVSPGEAPFALGIIEEFVELFGSQDIAFITQRVRDAEHGRSVYHEFRQQLRLLELLLHLKSEFAETLTFKTLGVRNEVIRSTGALIAAIRWPERLISMSSRKGLEIDEDEWIRLLAVVAMLHPDQVESAAGATNRELLPIQTRIQQDGAVAVFGLAGSIVAGH